MQNCFKHFRMSVWQIERIKIEKCCQTFFPFNFKLFIASKERDKERERERGRERERERERGQFICLSV